jgi:hypothetical protein
MSAIALAPRSNLEVSRIYPKKRLITVSGTIAYRSIDYMTTSASDPQQLKSRKHIYVICLGLIFST